MPIYEYRCSTCSHELETLQKFSDPLLTQCPSCGKDTLVKKISAAGFQLKGTGWYATDFKGSGSKPAANDAKAAEGKAGGDAKSGDAKSGDAKSGDAKAGDGKAGESKSEGTKSEAATATAPTSGTRAA